MPSLSLICSRFPHTCSQMITIHINVNDISLIDEAVAVQHSCKRFCEYGFTGISILRALNDDETKVKEEGAWLSTNKTDTEKRYSGTIGKEKAGTKVTFQILAVSAYGVYTFSEVYEYTVQEETDPEPMPNPEAN